MSKPGYKFKGWRDTNTTPVFEGLKQSGEVFTMPNRPVQLKAEWELEE